MSRVVIVIPDSCSGSNDMKEMFMLIPRGLRLDLVKNCSSIWFDRVSSCVNLSEDT